VSHSDSVARAGQHTWSELFPSPHPNAMISLVSVISLLLLQGVQQAECAEESGDPSSDKIINDTNQKVNIPLFSLNTSSCLTIPAMHVDEPENGTLCEEDAEGNCRRDGPD